MLIRGASGNSVSRKVGRGTTVFFQLERQEILIIGFPLPRAFFACDHHLINFSSCLEDWGWERQFCESKRRCFPSLSVILLTLFIEMIVLEKRKWSSINHAGEYREYTSDIRRLNSKQRIPPDSCQVCRREPRKPEQCSVSMQQIDVRMNQEPRRDEYNRYSQGSCKSSV